MNCVLLLLTEITSPTYLDKQAFNGEVVYSCKVATLELQVVLELHSSNDYLRYPLTSIPRNGRSTIQISSNQGKMRRSKRKKEKRYVDISDFAMAVFIFRMEHPLIRPPPHPSMASLETRCALFSSARTALAFIILSLRLCFHTLPRSRLRQHLITSLRVLVTSVKYLTWSCSF